MAYIGKAPNTAIVNQATSQSFSGNGSTTAFTLTRSVNVGEDLEVFVNNVQQEPGSGKSYTASGTTLTFDEAPPSGTNNVYVIYRGEATINPRLEHDANAALAATTGTFTSNVSVTGNVTADGLRLGDSDYAAFGDGLDLQIQHNGTGSFITDAGTGDLHIRADNNLLIQDAAGSTNRVAVNSTGVGIGTNSPSVPLHLSTSSSGDIAIFNTSANNGTGLYINSQTEGQIDLVGYDGSAANNVNIRGGGATNSGLVVGTGGDIFVGQTSTITPGSGNTTHGTCLQDGGRLFLSADGVFSLSLNRSDSGELTNFHRAGAFKGSINITTSGVSYNTSSDHRLKENVADMTGAIDRVKQLAPKRFNFIEDADNTVDGFLAHEAQAVVPEAVTGEHNEVDEDGNAVMQGIDQAKLVPLLTGALQEAIAEIETLKTKVAALEGN